MHWERQNWHSQIGPAKIVRLLYISASALRDFHPGTSGRDRSQSAAWNHSSETPLKMRGGCLKPRQRDGSRDLWAEKARPLKAPE